MDALTLLKRDHQAVEELFKKFEQAGDKAHKTKRKLVDQIIVELSRHASIEEAIFYPAAREALADAEEDSVLEALEEHHVVKWILNELLHLSAEHERFDAKMSVLMESVRHHVKEEETELFPKVRRAIEAAELRALGERLEEAKKTAPTRPHPRSPDSPPGNLVTTPVAAAIDKGRDLLRSLTMGARARSEGKQQKPGGGKTVH